MRLLIVEPEASGHHLALYTRLILREAKARGWAAGILTTRSAKTHPAFELAASQYGDQLHVFEMPDIRPAQGGGSLELFRAQSRLWRTLRRASKGNRHFRDFDLVYCVNFDYFEKALSLFGSPFGPRPLAGMLMNPKFHRAPMGVGPRSRTDRLYRFLFKRLLAIGGLKRLLVIDPTFQDYCDRIALRNRRKIALVPDVGELGPPGDRDAAREALGIPPDAFVVLVYGALAPRKGLRELLGGIRLVENGKAVVLAAGQADAEMTAFLASPEARAAIQAGGLFVENRFLDDRMERDVFAASDLVWLGYVGGAYGSSGVLYQAGSAGLPVVAMDEGLIGWMVRTHELGITLDPRDNRGVADAIRRLQEDSDLRQRLGANGRSLAGLHTGSAFGEAVCDALEPPGSHRRGRIPRAGS